MELTNPIPIGWELKGQLLIFVVKILDQNRFEAIFSLEKHFVFFFLIFIFFNFIPDSQYRQ